MGSQKKPFSKNRLDRMDPSRLDQNRTSGRQLRFIEKFDPVEQIRASGLCPEKDGWFQQEKECREGLERIYPKHPPSHPVYPWGRRSTFSAFSGIVSENPCALLIMTSLSRRFSVFLICLYSAHVTSWVNPGRCTHPVILYSFKDRRPTKSLPSHPTPFRFREALAIDLIKTGSS